jgi:predicted small lipoprotein YifL
MTGPNTLSRLAAAALLSVLVAGCGVRGALVPPEGRDTLLGPAKDFPDPTGEPSSATPAPESAQDAPGPAPRPRFPAPEAVN